jgi:hypothetical protein
MMLFLSGGCWKDDEAGVYGVPLAELAEVPEVVGYESSVLVDAVPQDLGVGAAEK